MKLIDKDPLVVEIDRRMKNLTHEMSKFYYASNYNEWKFAVNEYKSLMSFINTLEVEGVDLEKEASRFVQTKEFAECEEPVLCLAKYFFELGLKAKQV
jgi:hypothetical protein